MTPDEKKAALDRLVVTCRELRELERKIRPFNTFEVLKSAHNEIRHSNVLAWLLDPDGSHGLRHLFLRRWLMLVFYGVGSQGNSLDPIKLDCARFRTVKVRREWHNIDVLLEIETETEERWVICIENKIRSRQRENQLEKYYNCVETFFSGYTRAYIFLTVTSEPPDDPHYVMATYAQVCSALETCLAEHSGSIGEGPRMLMDQYLSILKERFMENSEISKLVAEIWAQHKDALEIILNDRPDNIRSLTNTVKALMQTNGFRLVPTDAWGRVRFMPNSWANSQDLKDPVVLCDIKFSTTEQSGHPIVRAYVFPKRSAELSINLYAELNRNANRGPKDYPDRYVFFTEHCHEEELFVGSLEAAVETEIPELAKKLFNWVRAKLSEPQFKDLDNIVIKHFGGNNI